MTSCSQVEDLDALVMGELDASDARGLTSHAAACEACAKELATLTAERELFAARAEALRNVAPPPPLMALTAALASAGAASAPSFGGGEPRRRRETRETPETPEKHGRSSRGRALRGIRRALPALRRVAMRGHFTAACAAALFVVAALSRVGTASMSMSMSMSPDDGVASSSADDGARAPGMLASSREGEPLACGVGARAFAARPEMRDDGDVTSSSSSSSGAAHGELLACVGSGGGGGARDVETNSAGAASCEPSVTCSALRQ